MTMNRRNGFSALGVGAAACAACCAPPILAFLGGLGIVGLASTLLIGALGLVVVAAAVAAFLVIRRRRPATPCGAETGEAGHQAVEPARSDEGRVLGRDLEAPGPVFVAAVALGHLLAGGASTRLALRPTPQEHTP